MLRIQRYELLLKALVLDTLVEGTAESAPVNQQKRKEHFSNKPMGYLFDELNRSYLRQMGGPEGEEEEAEVHPDKPTFRTRFAMAMEKDDLERTQKQLDDLKNLRNRIVHHLYEEHDLATASGCQSALVVLDKGLADAQANFEMLQQWCNTAIEARQHMVAFMQGPHFMDFLDGILPDGTIDWPSCTAVRLLRREEKGTVPGQMTRLDLAIEAIKATHPDHRPRKYFCQNWRELLQKSGQFEIRKQKGDAEHRGVTWYRSLERTAT